ncbi:MAG: alkyl sulfatase dimerization domain-containing protein [Pirellulaceae bacterium]|nr:alkyl sulfatase dimerization domain-containing protein [Pirellulaceae bacterium]
MFKFWKKAAPQPPCPARGTYPTKFEPRVETFGDVRCAIDYDLANLSMVKVEGGYIAIDAGTHPETTRKIAAEWERVAGGPIQALIYTHSHPDHIGGADGFALEGVPIWAQGKFMDELGDMQLLPNATFSRGVRQSGSVLPVEVALSNGIGPPLRKNDAILPPLHVPTKTFDRTEELVIGGRPIILRSSPGETHDHLSVWLPEQRIVFAGDNIYKAFPNLYTLRGMSARPVRRWIETLDEMRRLRPDVVVLGHTASIQGAETIYALLTDYRDAIAFVHDSVVRGINAGKSPNQLAREIRLPPHLAEHPFLREHYGTLAGSVRGVYTGYMGWFDGDASNVDPEPASEVGGWLVDELGGKREVLKRIEQATAKGDLRRALWLCRMLHGHSPDCRETQAAKALALEKIAHDCDNPLVRNWQLSEAALLRQSAKLPAKPKVTGATIERTPIARILGLLPSRLNPKTSANVTMAIGFDILDKGQQYTLLIRRGVGELATGIVGKPEITIRATERDMKRVFLVGEVPPTKLEFWQSLEFAVADKGVLTPLHRLMQLARVGRLFLRA